MSGAEEKDQRPAPACYIRSVVLGDATPRDRKRRTPAVADQTLLAESPARLGASRSTSNLDQIAKDIHLGTLPIDPHLERELRRARAEVACMRRALMLSGPEQAKQPDPAPPSSPCISILVTQPRAGDRPGASRPFRNATEED